MSWLATFALSLTVVFIVVCVDMVQRRFFYSRPVMGFMLSMGVVCAGLFMMAYVVRNLM